MNNESGINWMTGIVPRYNVNQSETIHFLCPGWTIKLDQTEHFPIDPQVTTGKTNKQRNTGEFYFQSHHQLVKFRCSEPIKHVSCRSTQNQRDKHYSNCSNWIRIQFKSDKRSIRQNLWLKAPFLKSYVERLFCTLRSERFYLIKLT